MRTTIQTSKKGKKGKIETKSSSTSEVLAKPTVDLTVPIRDNLSTEENICLGFRMEMGAIGDKPMGRIDTGTGLGTDFIILEWKGRTAVVRGSELLKAWVATFAPEDAARIG